MKFGKKPPSWVVRIVTPFANMFIGGSATRFMIEIIKGFDFDL